MAINYWHNLDYDCYYHIYNRSIDGIDLFREELDYFNFLKKYRLYFQPYIETYAYCLIPNHFHFIVRVKRKSTITTALEQEITKSSQQVLMEEEAINTFLADQMKRLFSSFSKRYNGKYKRKGPVFAAKVKRVWIKNDDRLRHLIAYVHHNPIHHNMFTEYAQWKYSSYQALTSAKPTLLARVEVLDLYGSLEEFMNFHNSFKLEKFEGYID